MWPRIGETKMARRRRSKYAIDFNQDINVVASLVVKDLLRKHPRGATGKLTRDDYPWGSEPEKCRAEAAQREGVGIYCGYTEEQLWPIFGVDGPLYTSRTRRRELEKGWHREQPGNADKSDEEIGEMYDYWIPCATMTRRKNRIDDRVRTMTRDIEERGRPGIYKVSTGYRSAFSDVPFFVWAQNRSEAKGQFETLTKPLIAAVDTQFTMESGVDVRQHAYDVESSELLDATQITIDKMDDQEAQWVAQIEKLQNQLEGLRGIKEMVTDMAVQTITSINS